MPNKRFEELRATGALPTPPGIGMEILRVTANPDCSVDELSRLIQGDPALTGRLLQIANSASASGGRACATVKDATTRLGLRAVRATALGFSLVSAHRGGACAAFDYGVFWSQSLARAVASSVLAARYRVGTPSEAFVAGLLSDLGSLALAMVHPREFAAILAAAESATAAGRAELEQRRFGIDHREVSATMLQEWKLPDAFSTAAAGVGSIEAPTSGAKRDASSLSTLVWIAARFAEAFVIPEDRPLDIDRVRRALQQLGDAPPKLLPELWTQIADNWRQWGGMFEIVTTAVPPYGEGAPTRARLASPLLVQARPPVRTADSARTDPLLRTAVTPAVLAGIGAASATTSSQPVTSRVIAVHHDAAALRALAAHLQTAGYEVRTATSADHALKLAMSSLPQIFIVDWSLPGIGGIGLVSALRAFEAGGRVYVVALVGERDEKQIIEAFDAGLDDYLVAPATPNLLLARLRAGLRVVHMQERIDADKAIMQRQVAELGVLTRQLEHAAVTDALTELPNRRFALEALREGWERSVREDAEFSVVMLDLDRFKRINDTHGHDAGDAVLRAIGGVLRKAVVAPACACRLGGEEFVVVLPGVDGARAHALAESLRASIGAERVRSGTLDGAVTASFGVASRAAGAGDCEQLLKLADAALYRAKEAGRDRVARATSSDAAIASALPARR